jgi:hypothetical protein
MPAQWEAARMEAALGRAPPEACLRVLLKSIWYTGCWELSSVCRYSCDASR